MTKADLFAYLAGFVTIMLAIALTDSATIFLQVALQKGKKDGHSPNPGSCHHT